jgi:hypothetical protein
MKIVDKLLAGLDQEKYTFQQKSKGYTFVSIFLFYLVIHKPVTL